MNCNFPEADDRSDANRDAASDRGKNERDVDA